MFATNPDAQLWAVIDAIILCGSPGEASTLENHERTALPAFTKKRVNSSVQVILNIVDQSTKE